MPEPKAPSTRRSAIHPHPSPAPSQVTDAFFVHASPVGNDLTDEEWFNDTPKESRGGPGKWLIFRRNGTELDSAWDAICKAIESGRLATHAKCSTAKPNPNARDPDKGVICVYTDDAADEADVMRVREQLRGVGFTETLYYKADEATYAGRYQNRGHTGISSYRA
jgi:hypothetical protein